ncbi:MAG: hypothetical protein AAFO69_00425 [Bacteroidota bacterium]
MDGSGNTWRVTGKEEIRTKRWFLFQKSIGIISLKRLEKKMTFDEFVKLYVKRTDFVSEGSTRKILRDILEGENSIKAVIEKCSPI